MSEKSNFVRICFLVQKRYDWAAINEKSMSKQAYIIHGWGASPDANWFPWVSGMLGFRGVPTIVPQMPRADQPILSEWISHMHAIIGKPTSEKVLIGHSLGTISILRYLEALPQGEEVGLVILVAAFHEYLGFPELAEFTDAPLDWATIRKKCRKCIIIQSQDDPLVPFSQ